MPTNYNPDTDALETMQERFEREAEVDERIIRRQKNTSIPAIVFYPAGSLGEPVDSEGDEA